VTTNLLPARTTVPAEHTPAPAQSPAAVGRRGFALLALAAGGVGALALMVPTGPVRLVMLLTFLLIGPGAAVMAHLPVRDRLVSWALAITASLSIACGTAVLMLWTHTWSPQIAVTILLDIVAAAAAVRFVLDRWLPARPMEFTRSLFVRRPDAADLDTAPATTAGTWRRRAGAVGPVVLLLAAVASWTWAITGFRPSTVDGYGLTPALGVPFVAAILLLTLAFAAELFGRARTWALTAGLVTAATVLHATVPLLYGNLEYAWTYKHIGVVDLIRDNGQLLNSTDIYQQWPGFFATMAVLSDVAGVDALAFATWSSLAFALLNMVLLAALLRQFTRNRRVVALGVLLFLICMWVDAGYFSPQAFVYALMLGFWLIVARWLIATPAAVPADAGRLARARGVLLRGFPVLAPRNRRTRVAAAVGATLVFAAITVSHQLSPFIMLLPAIPLAALGVLRPRSLVLVWGVLVLAFVAPRIAPVAAEYGLFDFDLFANAAGNADGLRTDAQRFSALVARILAVAVWAAALVAIGVHRRKLGTVLVPAILGFAPFVTLAAQSYGGEAIYRVFAFSLPFAALLVAGLWLRVRRNALVTVASGLVLAVVSLATVQGLQGQLAVHRVPPADVTAAEYFYANAQPNSSLVLLAPNFPTKLAGNYGSFNNGRAVDYTLIDHPAFTNSLDGSGLPAVQDYMGNLGTRHNYLVVSTQMTVYTDYFGSLPEGATASLQEALRVSMRWRVFYQGPGVTIYHMTPPSA